MTEDITSKRPRGRPRTFDMDLVLDRALQVFWTRGYEGASMDELTAAMELSRPSVYAAFGDKRGLFLQALDRYAGTIGRRPLDALHRSTGVEAGLTAFLNEVIEFATAGDTQKGCFLACVSTDVAACEPLVRGRLAEVIEKTDREISLYLTQAQAKQRTLTGLAPEVAAQLLVSLMQGIAIRARAGTPKSELEEFAHVAAKCLAGQLGDVA